MTLHVIRKKRLTSLIAFACLTATAALVSTANASVSAPTPTSESSNSQPLTELAHRISPTGDPSEVISQIVWNEVAETLDNTPGVMGFYTDIQTGTLHINIAHDSPIRQDLQHILDSRIHSITAESPETEILSSLTVVFDIVGAISDTSDA
ncbi:hypothetical protein [Trueperella sp. LYQ143]|uniref:hypothetical protein n=1 Tax=unclassified Trueperella TaxID=2630174 RepID=UPI00398307F7